MARGFSIPRWLAVPLLIWMAGCRGRRRIVEETASTVAPTVVSASSTSATAATGELRVGDLVDLPLATPLAASPAGAGLLETAGSPALVLGVSPGGHRRVIAADGSSGWTSASPNELASARVHPVVDLELARFVRGDPRRYDEAEHPWLVLGAGGVGALIGASVDREGVSDSAPVADELRFLDQPLLHLETKSGTGYVHGLSLDVEWNPPLEVDVRRPAAGAFRGIVRRPFLAPLKASALSLAPRDGETTHVVSEKSAAGNALDVLRAMPVPPHAWASVEAVVHDPAVGPEHIVSLAVVADGGALALVFVDGNSGRSSVILGRAQNDSPWVTRVETSDLDGDGRAEWLVELVTDESHGWWTRLLVVSGTSTTAELSGGIIALGGDPGEGDETTRFAWSVAGGRLFVARGHGNDAVSYESIVMTARKPVLDPKRVVVAIAGSFPDQAAAKLERSSKPPADRGVVLPIVLGGQARWSIGRFFVDPTAAKAWAASAGGRVL